MAIENDDRTSPPIEDKLAGLEPFITAMQGGNLARKLSEFNESVDLGINRNITILALLFNFRLQYRGSLSRQERLIYFREIQRIGFPTAVFTDQLDKYAKFLIHPDPQNKHQADILRGYEDLLTQANDILFEASFGAVHFGQIAFPNTNKLEPDKIQPAAERSELLVGIRNLIQSDQTGCRAVQRLVLEKTSEIEQNRHLPQPQKDAYILGAHTFLIDYTLLFNAFGKARQDYAIIVGNQPVL